MTVLKWFRSAPDRSASDRSAPDRAAPDRAAPDRAAPDRAASDRAASDADDTADWTAVAVPVIPKPTGQSAADLQAGAVPTSGIGNADDSPQAIWDSAQPQTNTQPTNTQPTNTQPTNTQPTNTQQFGTMQPGTMQPGNLQAGPLPTGGAASGFDPASRASGAGANVDELRGMPRVVAAEVGVYLGAGLMVLTGVLGTISGWPDWSDRTRVAVVSASGLGLLAAAAWLREAGGAELAAVRRRATSGLLCTAIAVLLGPIWGAFLAGSDQPVWALPLVALAGLLLTWGADRVAHSPYSQTAILVWAALIVIGVPQVWRVWCLPALVGLGLAWALLGWRYMPARRSAAVAGVLLALGACAVAATGVWSWPARGLLLATGLGAFWRFLRGGRSAWLALGVAGWAALAATAAGAVLGPLLALAIGGAVTVAVSLVALLKSIRQ